MEDELADARNRGLLPASAKKPYAPRYGAPSCRNWRSSRRTRGTTSRRADSVRGQAKRLLALPGEPQAKPAAPMAWPSAMGSPMPIGDGADDNFHVDERQRGASSCDERAGAVTHRLFPVQLGERRGDFVVGHRRALVPLGREPVDRKSVV